MYTIDSFVHSSNVDRYLDQLATEPDDMKCATLLKLLVEEENKLARNREELIKAERRVSDGNLRIKNLSSVAAYRIENGHDLSRTIALLVTMQDTQRLLERHHQKLRDELGER